MGCHHTECLTQVPFIYAVSDTNSLPDMQLDNISSYFDLQRISLKF